MVIGAGISRQGVVEIDDKVFANALTKENIKKIQENLIKQIVSAMPVFFARLKQHDSLIRDISTLEDEVSSLLSSKKKKINTSTQVFLVNIGNVAEKISSISPNVVTEKEKIEYLKNLHALRSIPYRNGIMMSYNDVLSASHKEQLETIRILCKNIESDLDDVFSTEIKTDDYDGTIENTVAAIRDMKVFENYNELRGKFLQLRREIKKLSKE